MTQYDNPDKTFKEPRGGGPRSTRCLETNQTILRPVLRPLVILVQIYTVIIS